MKAVKKSNLNCFYRKTKGFTVMELLISMSISLIIIGSLITILGGGIGVLEKSIPMEKNLYEGRYVLDFISREINRSVKVYPIEDAKFNVRSRNLGFILKMKPSSVNNYDWQYTYYELKGNDLIRKTKNTNIERLEDLDNFSGSGQNKICKNIKSIEKSYYDKENNLINISIVIGDKIEKEFSTSVYTGLKAKGEKNEEN